MRFPYTRSVNIAEVEELRGARWREETGALLDAGCRLLALFALPGVLSRKKQLLPQILAVTAALQQD